MTPKNPFENWQTAHTGAAKFRMVDKPLYTPTQVDIDWAKSMMALVAQDGILAFPSAQLIYDVDHEHKTLTLQNPERLATHFDSFVTHNQTVVVFKIIGYEVKEKA